MDALEAPRNMLDLPAFFLPDLLALHTAAGTGTFLWAQLMNLRRDRKVLEVGQVPPALAPPHAPEFLIVFGTRRNILGVDGLLVLRLSEAQQHLRQVAGRLKKICKWPVIPIHVASQLYLQTQILEVQIVAL